MGSAAKDHEGNIAVGFSVSSTTALPRFRTPGGSRPIRRAGSPRGRPLFGGQGVQTGTNNRWGDYSGLQVDPTDYCTFWYTNEYYTAGEPRSTG